MSKITIAILYTVIGGIIAGIYAGVPYLEGGPGALIVIALVYSFVVAKREMEVMSLALAIEVEEMAEDDFDDQPIIPDWLKHVPGQPQTA